MLCSPAGEKPRKPQTLGVKVVWPGQVTRSFPYLFGFLVKTYLLSFYHVPDSVLRVNSTKPIPHGTCILLGTRGNQRGNIITVNVSRYFTAGQRLALLRKRKPDQDEEGR